MDTPIATTDTFGMDLTPEEVEDTHAVFEKLATGKPIPPHIYTRIRERAARISREIYEKHGLLDIGVPAIRALRDGDDE